MIMSGVTISKREMKSTVWTTRKNGTSQQSCKQELARTQMVNSSLRFLLPSGLMTKMAPNRKMMAESSLVGVRNMMSGTLLQTHKSRREETAVFNTRRSNQPTKFT